VSFDFCRVRNAHVFFFPRQQHPQEELQSKRSGQEQETNGCDPRRQLFNDAMGTKPPTKKQSTTKTKKVDGPWASAMEIRSNLEMLPESPSISTADELVSNLDMIETCSANIRRNTQMDVAPAKTPTMVEHSVPVSAMHQSCHLISAACETPMSSSPHASSTHKKNSKRSGQEQETDVCDPRRQLFDDAAGTTPPTKKQSTPKTKKADGPWASATETRSILEMLSESPFFSTADDLVSNLHMIETCFANICRITQMAVAPAKESDNSTSLGINKTSTTKSEREEHAGKNLKDREKARKWHKDNIDHKNNADLNTKLIQNRVRRLFFLRQNFTRLMSTKIWPRGICRMKCMEGYTKSCSRLPTRHQQPRHSPRESHPPQLH